MKKWQLTIKSVDGTLRSIPLEHEYETVEEAEREAEDIADQEYTDTDEGWSVTERR